MRKTADKNWNRVLGSLRELLEETLYNTWIAGLKLANYDKNTNVVFLTVPNDSELIKVKLEERYKDLIMDHTKEVFGDISNLFFLTSMEADRMFGPAEKKEVDIPWGDENILNPRYTFETFVPGDNNRYPKAAAMAVAEDPGKAYNPLFIYGDSGLGKTHLMHAIGHYVMVHAPKKTVLYVSSEMFTNEFVTATQKNRMNDFKAKYRNVDVLMIDDIQFIVGREKTIEEVFNTYNTLYNMGKQLVFSSDRPPNTLEMDPRMTSRLSSGLPVDLQTPSFETKVAILRNKAEMYDIPMTEGLQDVIDIIAEKIKTNVREMEGALNMVVSNSLLDKQPITKAQAKKVLKNIITSKDIQPTPELIKKIVSKKYDIKVSDLDSAKRDRSFSNPRQLAMYLCREMTDLSLPKIGEFFGGRDHTTILHACKKIESSRSSNEQLDSIINELEEAIRNA